MLRSRPFAVLTHPIPVWALYFGIMFAFFLSSLINVAMHHMALMDVLNVIFLLGGCLYWWPMVGADPIVHWKMGYGARMVNVLLGGPPEVILGLAILSARTPIASMYTLSSTHAGGALLWISTEFAVIAGFIPIFWQWSRSDARAAARLDAQADARQAAQIDAAQAADRDPGHGHRHRPDSPRATATDWADWQMTTWEATWQAKAGRVPYPHTYSQQAIKKRGAAAFSPNHDDWPTNHRQSSPSQQQTDQTTRSAMGTDARQPSSASTADVDWYETGTPTTNPRQAGQPSATPATNPVRPSLEQQPTRQGSQTSPEMTSPRVPTGSYRRIRSRRHRQLRWLLGGTAILALAVVGGPAVFFHLVEGHTPARLSLPAAGQVGTGPIAAGPVNGTWVVTAGSQAGYRVQEILFGQHHTAVGRTSKITGHLIISGATVTAADFNVDMAAIKSDQPSRDAQFDGHIMETYKYRQATFRPQPTHPAGRHPGARKYRHRADHRSAHPARDHKDGQLPPARRAGRQRDRHQRRHPHHLLVLAHPQPQLRRRPSRPHRPDRNPPPTRARVEVATRRVVTLTGVDAVGKIRLASQLAAEVLPCFGRGGGWSSWRRTRTLSGLQALGRLFDGARGRSLYRCLC